MLQITLTIYIALEGMFYSWKVVLKYVFKYFNKCDIVWFRFSYLFKEIY